MMDIFDIRKEFTLKALDEKDISNDPLSQFEVWYEEASRSQVQEPNAMCLATTGTDMKPSARMVLLKQVKDNGFVFFTNYDSKKALQIEQNSYCALTFAWIELERQVRIEGSVEKLSPEDSDAYFERRPAASRLGAWASPQSEVIPDRKYLESLVEKFEKEFPGDVIPRPENWGGYIVKPVLIEFWQGRPNRLHDRIQYSFDNGKWIIKRLAP